MSLTTEYIEQINRTPAVQLAVEGHTYLFDYQLTDPVTQVSWNNSAILGRVDGELAGVITFTHTKWAKQFDISIGYVRPRYQGRGLYRAMWNALVVKAQDLSAVSIQGNTSIKNDHMRAVAEALGRIERGVILGFDVPTRAEPPVPE